MMKMTMKLKLSDVDLVSSSCLYHQRMQILGVTPRTPDPQN